MQKQNERRLEEISVFLHRREREDWRKKKLLEREEKVALQTAVLQERKIFLTRLFRSAASKPYRGVGRCLPFCFLRHLSFLLLLLCEGGLFRSSGPVPAAEKGRRSNQPEAPQIDRRNQYVPEEGPDLPSENANHVHLRPVSLERGGD